MSTGSGDEFETASRLIVFERKVHDGNDHPAVYCDGMLFISVEYRVGGDVVSGVGGTNGF